MNRILIALVALGCVGGAILSGTPHDIKSFADPIDALSVQLPDKNTHVRVSSFDGKTWSAWEDFSIEDEQDPTTKESNLVMFDTPVSLVRFDHPITTMILHPIRVSSAPPKIPVASTKSVGTPRILTRAEWGADETIRISSKAVVVDDTSDIETVPIPSGNLTTRQQDCLDAQRNYPDDFRRTGKVVTTYNGQPLSWPIEYSPTEKILAVHHTAIKATGETRTGAERMRALYQYHAKSRGWGDIGYNYVIDDTGQIYEGRAGGDYAIAGHAYCNNVDTIGISLMGNFEVEQPTQDQVKSLEWLLDSLAKKYKIDTTKTVTYHGETLPAIVGHRQLVSTECPGYYLYGAIDQIRANVAAEDFSKDVVFPEPKENAVARQLQKPVPNLVVSTKGTFFFETADLVGRPGDFVTFSLRFLASTPLKQRTGIGTITRSDPSMSVWLVGAQESLKMGTTLLLPTFVRKGDTITLHLRVQLPVDPGNYTLKIDKLTYNLTAEGRRSRVASNPVGQRRLQRAAEATLGRGTDLPTVSASDITHATDTATAASVETSSEQKIRIRLSYASSDPNQPQTAFITVPGTATINGQPVSGTVVLEKKGDNCQASNSLGFLTDTLPRIDVGTDTFSIPSWNRSMNAFHGVLECRIIDNQLTLINELPLDTYMLGLGEEPDSEPYEKQRAFAIAARTYAAWYMDAAHRKFAGKPYDGSDSPAEFQKYNGANFEAKNPSWVNAVESTADKVLTKGGQLIKPPYFSSDDGRTRSPEEAKWKGFPFSEIFSSKPDPWCQGKPNSGHLVGMSGCGARGQAEEGKVAEDILNYYYPGTALTKITPAP